MSIELKIPNVGESIQEVQIGQWLKQEGDRVEHDETIVELETDKASMELPAPINGVISKIVKRDGDSVAVGDVIAYLDPDGQATDDKGGEKEQARPAEKPKEQTEPRETAPAKGPSGAADTTGPVKPPYEIASEPLAKSVEHDDEPAAPPSVRRLLREHHIRRKMSNRPVKGDDSCGTTSCVTRRNTQENNRLTNSPPCGPPKGRRHKPLW